MVAAYAARTAAVVAPTTAYGRRLSEAITERNRRPAREPKPRGRGLGLR
jgi:hypothetical protein